MRTKKAGATRDKHAFSTVTATFYIHVFNPLFLSCVNRLDFHRHPGALKRSLHEVGIRGKRYTEEFKVEAVRQVTDQGGVVY